jgi:UDP-N-acetylglucosamine acyltransferase
MVGGMSRITRDVPPFTLVEGDPAKVYLINVVGLRRAGFSQELRAALQTAARLLFHSGLNLMHAVDRIRQEIPSYPEVEYLIGFMEAIREGRNGRQLDRPSRKL